MKLTHKYKEAFIYDLGQQLNKARVEKNLDLIKASEMTKYSIKKLHNLEGFSHRWNNMPLIELVRLAANFDKMIKIEFIEPEN